MVRSQERERERWDRSPRAGIQKPLITCILPVRSVLSFVALGLALACGADRPPAIGDGDPAGGSGGTAPAAGAAGSSGSAGSDPGAGGGAMAGAAGMGGAGGDSALPGCIAREGCQRLCAVLGDDPASCEMGNAEQCHCICEERFSGPCPDELDALVACVGDAPAIDCSVRGRIFPGCEAASFDLEVCDFVAREQLCAQSYPLCRPFCEASTLSFCPQGPESLTSCLCGCEASLATRCATELEAFMSCSSGAPEFTCDAAGRPVPTGCDVEWRAIEGCLGVPSSAPDAG